MASEEHVLLNLHSVSFHFGCRSCGLYKVNLQLLQHKHKLHCFRDIYGADMKVPEFLEITQLKDPNGATTDEEKWPTFPYLLGMLHCARF